MIDEGDSGMPHVHDRGGWPEAGPVEKDEHDATMWEKRTDALMRLLMRKHYWRVDEMRRAIEAIEPGTYEKLTYYERWNTALETLLIEKRLLTREEIDRTVKAQQGQAG